MPATAVEEAPVCGPCLLLISHLRRMAAALLKIADGAVWPERPIDAWASLGDTRWAARFDLDEFLSEPDLDSRIRFDAILAAVDPATVDAMLEEMDEPEDDDLEPGR